LLELDELDMQARELPLVLLPLQLAVAFEFITLVVDIGSLIASILRYRCPAVRRSLGDAS
jgi:hypothetical protein